MFKKENRLKKNKDFNAVFKERKFFRLSFFLFGFKKNDLEYSRFGIIVNKKISKQAVLRNRIKRIIREVVRKKIDEIKKGYDIVIIPSKEIKEKTFQEIESAIEKSFKKIMKHETQS